MRDEARELGVRVVLAFARFWFGSISTWGLSNAIVFASRALPIALLVLLVVVFSGSQERLVY